MLSALEQLSPLAAELTRRATGSGVRLIWRTQTRSIRSLLVRDGRSEGTSVSSSSGHGLHVMTEDGRTALGSRDDLRPDAALELLERTVEVARQSDRLGVGATSFPDIEATVGRAVPDGMETFSGVDLAHVASRLSELENRLLGEVPAVQLSLSYRADLDAWRIFRSDGTDVLYAMPRCIVGMRATAKRAGPRHRVSAGVFSSRADLLEDPEVVDRFVKRARRAARLALDLPGAPSQPAGSFPVVIDYALAKGLAHEAFGHSAEADGFRSSVLATDGRLRRGERVGAEHVSIIDEPVPHDHAWQPFSSNGLPRDRAVLVDHGRLCDGLSDVWSSGPGGVRLTGAARAESYRHAPQPRMTNIRIESDEALPAPGEFEDYGPTEVRQLLSDAGVFRRNPELMFLSGYSGGQVNTATGDFVFNCKAIYAMSPERIELRKPAIFSGSMFGALGAVREAFGPLRLDALGTCGKWGQSVPSSGGSHYFLVLDADPTVHLGGA